MEFLEKILNSPTWRHIMTNFDWIDWVTAAFVIGGIVYGIRRGFLRVTVKTLEVLLIAYITFLFREKAAGLLKVYFSFLADRVIPAGGFIVVALPIAIVVLILDSHLVQIFHTSLAAPIRVIGGALVGAFYGMFLWSFLAQPLVLTPVRAVQRNFDAGTSVTGAFVKNLAPDIFNKLKR